LHLALRQQGENLHQHHRNSPFTQPMKLFPHKPKLFRAFTFVEAIVASAVFVMATAGTLTAMAFGLDLYKITRAKLGASDDARQTLMKLVRDVQTALVIQVGNGSLNTFSEIPNGQRQEGNAVLIYRSTLTNDWIKYYYDPSDLLLKRTEDGSSGIAVMAHSISQEIIFTSEDYRGIILTNHLNNRLIGLTLQIKSFQWPKVAVGPNEFFDAYQLTSKISRRVF
jgi:hypothetical protein